jgi:transcriptional regulator with XRE-family HTH domain
MEQIHPLKAFRENQKPPLSQEQLANLLGVSRVTVTRWESGTRRVDDDLLPRVSEKTGIPTAVLRPDMAELMNRSPPTSPDQPAPAPERAES